MDKDGEKNDDGIDYKAEGSTPPEEKESDTNAGYDEAAHSGPSRYGVGEGNGGVFGTTGGGTYDGGMQVIERPGVYDRTGAAGAFEPDEKPRGTHSRELEGFDHVSLESTDKSKKE